MKKKTNWDEGQEQKLLQIEHRGCWLAFWGLTAVIIAQGLLEGYEAHIWGELIVMLGLSLYLLVACIRKGIWDRKREPTPGMSLLSAAIAGTVVGVLQGIISYRNYGMLLGSLATAAFGFLFTFALTYALMLLSVWLYKKRRKQLDDICEEEDT